MKKRLLSIFLCALLVATLLPVTVLADVAPKSSTTVTFLNLGDELCYGTLLSETSSTGLNAAWDGTESDARYSDYAIWKAFVEYEDPDGYYFLQCSWQVNKSKILDWTAAPPARFKILLYFPETGTFVSSGIYERYALDSYYTVNMAGVNISSVEHGGAPMKAYKSYNYPREILSLLARIVLTILLELGVALLFGFREKNVLLLIAKVNILTQSILNVLLNIVDYRLGFFASVLCYFFLEAIVLLIESSVFSARIPKLSSKKRAGFVAGIYALVANIVSFVAGLFLGLWLPILF